MGANANEFLRASELQSQNYLIEETPCNEWQISAIEMLLKHSNIDHSEREDIERKMLSFSEEEAYKTIEYLRENQLDPIVSGFNYSQTDICKYLKNRV